MEHEEQFKRNLTHAFALFEVLLDDPSRLDVIPQAVTIVAMPTDDQELCAANEEMLRADRQRAGLEPGARRHDLSGSTLLVNV